MWSPLIRSTHSLHVPQQRKEDSISGQELGEVRIRSLPSAAVWTGWLLSLPAGAIRGEGPSTVRMPIATPDGALGEVSTRAHIGSGDPAQSVRVHRLTSLHAQLRPLAGAALQPGDPARESFGLHFRLPAPAAVGVLDDPVKGVRDSVPSVLTEHDLRGDPEGEQHASCCSTEAQHVDRGNGHGHSPSSIARYRVHPSRIPVSSGCTSRSTTTSWKTIHFLSRGFQMAICPVDGETRNSTL